MGRFFCIFYLLTISKFCGIIGRRANGPGAPSFLSIGRFNKFLGQIFVHKVNRQNPESVLYYNHSKGRKTYQTGKGFTT